MNKPTREINNENYFDSDMSMYYMGATQFKEFMQCEAHALALAKHEVESGTPSMENSSYIDAYFSGEMDQFVESHPDMFKKNGELKASFVHMQEVCDFVEEDDMFMKYISGDMQPIMTGEIAGVPFKIKIDAYHKDLLIVDMKAMKDFNLIWNEKKKIKENFIDYYRYDIQGAIYQEIVYQNTGKRLPFYIAAMTKEKVPNKAILSISQAKLNDALELVKNLAPRFQAIKEGKIEPRQCGRCDYCKKNFKVQEVVDYEEYFNAKERR